MTTKLLLEGHETFNSSDSRSDCKRQCWALKKMYSPNLIRPPKIVAKFYKIRSTLTRAEANILWPSGKRHNVTLVVTYNAEQ